MWSSNLAKYNCKRRPLPFGVDFLVEFPQWDDVAVRSNQLDAHIALRDLNLIAFGSFCFHRLFCSERARAVRSRFDKTNRRCCRPSVANGLHLRIGANVSESKSEEMQGNDDKVTSGQNCETKTKNFLTTAKN